MGNHHSRKDRIKNNRNRVDDQVMNMGQRNQGRTISHSSYDQEQISKLSDELNQNPEMFVLNHILMSVVFFENYESEKHQMLEERTTLEKEINPILLREQKTECITPDLVFHHVNKHVHFSLKNNKINENAEPAHVNAEPLVPRRMFVINDSIEVVKSSDSPEYSGIDKPNYQVQMQESEKIGFVRLKKLITDANKVVAGRVVEPQPGPSTREDPEGEIYEYTTITEMNTPKPLEVNKEGRRDTLPKTCFVGRKERKYDEGPTDETDDDEDNEDLEEDPNKEPEGLFEHVTYISSKSFMEHFQNGVFPNGLAQALGFREEFIADAKSIPGKIFCTLEDAETDAPLPCEVVPSIAIPRPSALTYEFYMRGERPVMYDLFGQKYLWPLETHIKEIFSYACVLIPKGCIPKRGTNVDSEIEWEVAFPKAERFLDIHMNHTQTRAFLYLLLIFRTYIEPATKHHGLLIEHIRTLIYWECESNPRDWPEHRLGTKLLNILKDVERKLSVAQIPHFFIKKKNILENTPNKYIHHAQRVIHNILQSPVNFFLAAVMRLTYVNSSNYYPMLNVKELHGILSKSDGELFDTINASIGNSIPPNFLNRKRQFKNENMRNLSKQTRWQMKKEQRNREIFLKKKEEKERENLKTHQEPELHEIAYGLNAVNFSHVKKRSVLIFFIKHFVELGKKSRRFQIQKQALFYLKQAYYLNTILMNDIPSAYEEASKFFQEIGKEEENCMRISITDSFDIAPTTPVRNSVQYNNWNGTQQVKNNKVNLNNLNNTFNSGMNATNTKKSTSNLKKSTSFKPSRSIDGRVVFAEKIDFHNTD